MATRAPFTLAEKERLYAAKLSGRSLAAIAAELGCSYQTARKWWRQARDHGRAAFLQARRGRAATGVLSRFAPTVTARALSLKRAHPTWGPDRVQSELQRDASLRGLRLPSRSRLAILFKTACPDLVAPRRPHSAPAAAPATPSAVHECWQLDCQEAIPLADDHRASICTIRDPVGAAILTSQAFDVTSGTRGRRLTWEEIRGVIRSAFARWETLPDQDGSSRFSPAAHSRPHISPMRPRCSGLLCNIEDRGSYLPAVQQRSGIIIAESMLPVRARILALTRAVCQRHEFIRHTRDVC